MSTCCGKGESGVPIPETIRKAGISRATYFLWKRKYGGATVAEPRRLTKREAENARFKRLYAGTALENAALKDVLSRQL